MNFVQNLLISHVVHSSSKHEIGKEGLATIQWRQQSSSTKKRLLQWMFLYNLQPIRFITDDVMWYCIITTLNASFSGLRINYTLQMILYLYNSANQIYYR